MNKEQTETIESTKRHRRRMRNMNFLMYAFLLVVSAVHFIIAIEIDFTWSYIFGGLFLGWLIGYVIKDSLTSCHYATEDMWRDGYFNLYDKLEEVIKWDGNHKQKKSTKKKK